MSSFDTPTVLVVSADQTQTVSINPRLLFIIKPLLVVLVQTLAEQTKHEIKLSHIWVIAQIHLMLC